MLSRVHRIVRAQDFSRIYKKGSRFSNAHLTLYYTPSPEAVRVGIVVSTKISKKSTRRNRIKRILRDEVRLQLPELPTGDYVIVVRPAIRDASAEIIRDAFHRAQKKQHERT